mmetsp:Transcript_138990/g.443820  ORF Transcript_138990/g.443820 Transcript_138990/m.443820 type:complete len:392 (-) Transcript_138990:8-1183(-)
MCLLGRPTSAKPQTVTKVTSPQVEPSAPHRSILRAAQVARCSPSGSLIVSSGLGDPISEQLRQLDHTPYVCRHLVTGNLRGMETLRLLFGRRRRVRTALCGAHCSTVVCDPHSARASICGRTDVIGQIIAHMNPAVSAQVRGSPFSRERRCTLESELEDHWRGLSVGEDIGVLSAHGEVKERSQGWDGEGIRTAVGDGTDHGIRMVGTDHSQGTCNALEKQVLCCVVAGAEPGLEYGGGQCICRGRGASGTLEHLGDALATKLGVGNLRWEVVADGPHLRRHVVCADGSGASPAQLLGHGSVGAADNRILGPQRVVQVEGDEAQCRESPTTTSQSERGQSRQNQHEQTAIAAGRSMGELPALKTAIGTRVRHGTPVRLLRGVPRAMMKRLR